MYKPESVSSVHMSAVKIIHTADNHLDPKVTMLGPKSMDRRRDFMNAFLHVVNCALERKPHLFLVSGDLFDSVNPRNPARTQVIRAFRRLYSEGVKVFMIAGNHDMPRSIEEGMSPLQEVEASGYARFFASSEYPEVEHIKVGDLDVAVVGLSFNPEVPFEENPLRYVNVKLPREGDLAVAMLHYNFAGVKAPPAWRAPTVFADDIPEGYRYVALGHVHSCAFVNLDKILVAYPGSTERRSFAEEEDQAKGFLWVELPLENKPKVEFIETPTRPLKTIYVKVQPQTDDPLKDIASAIPPPDLNLLLRLVVHGELKPAMLSRYSRAELLKHLERLFFYVMVDDRELRCTAGEVSVSSVETKSPIEAFKEEMEERMKRVEEGYRDTLAYALKLGLQKLEEVGAW